MSEEFVKLEGAPRVRLGRRERGGVFLGLNSLQILVLLCAVSVSLVWMFVATDTFWSVGLWPMLALAVFGGASWRRQPLILIVIHTASYLWRHLKSQTVYVRELGRTDKEITVRRGKPRPGQSVPERIGQFDLPGPAGSLRVYQCAGAGAFVLDERAGTIAITLELTTDAWPMLDSSAQEAAFDGFVGWMNSLDTLPGLVQLDARVRVDAAPTTELSEYVAARDSNMGDDHSITDSLRREYRELIQSGSNRSMAFTNQVTVTFAIGRLRQQIKDNGGGLAGLGGFLGELVPTMSESLAQSRLRWKSWLDAADLQAALSRAFDPASFAARTERANPAHGDRPGHPPVMAIREHADRLVVDGSIHQVFWIAEWPRTEKPTGFLERLLYAGDATRTLLLQIKPVPTEKAQRRIVQTKTGLYVAEDIRRKRGMTPTREQEREIEEVEEREDRLADGFADVEYRGFITISAEDKDGLSRARSAIEQTARGTGLVLALMYFQQAAAFATAALPTNAKGRR